MACPLEGPLDEEAEAMSGEDGRDCMMISRRSEVKKPS